MSTLTFDALRAANLDRMPQFRNRQGELSHASQGVVHWTPTQWGNATAGEFGEMLVEMGRFLQLCDKLKKLERGDFGPDIEQALILIGKELADCVIYLDLNAARLGINLGQAVIDKFNEVSIRVGATTRL